MIVAVAVSGGADSLMSLALLRESGADVFAVHARFLPGEDNLPGSLADLCQSWNIPLHVLDLRQEFEAAVIKPFVRAYQEGQTPNPCAACNPAMKFGLLLDKARALGAAKLATGHYARLRETPGPDLFRGQDATKDQSYFLSLVPRERFQNVLFPLGGWAKEQVRTELAARGLSAPAGRESQEICFIPGDYRDFLRASEARLSPPGPIALADGTVLGRHQGLWNHTLGQRKGLGVAYSEPLYVTGRDPRTNTLVVGSRAETLTRTCRTAVPNLLEDPQDWPSSPLVQTIYRQRPVPARVELHAQGMEITFTEPRALPAPGQIAAVYSEQGQLLAGGVIVGA